MLHATLQTSKHIRPPLWSPPIARSRGLCSTGLLFLTRDGRCTTPVREEQEKRGNDFDLQVGMLVTAVWLHGARQSEYVAGAQCGTVRPG